MFGLIYFDDGGKVYMVDVFDKDVIFCIVVVEGFIMMNVDMLVFVVEGCVEKGDVLGIV